MFDLPQADKCLLAYGELDVRCSMFISFLSIKPAAFQAGG
jgi:hypothetical protein